MAFYCNHCGREFSPGLFGSSDICHKCSEHFERRDKANYAAKEKEFFDEIKSTWRGFTWPFRYPKLFLALIIVAYILSFFIKTTPEKTPSNSPSTQRQSSFTPQNPINQSETKNNSQTITQTPIAKPLKNQSEIQQNPR